jgi:hypothetical protein
LKNTSPPFSDVSRVLAEAKYRTVMKGNAYATLVAAPGAAEVLAFLGFQNMPDRIVLPAGAAVEPSHLDYVLQMAEHRARERESKQAAELAKEKARKAAEKKLLEDRIAANRKEVAQRNPTVTSRSTLVPFSNKDKVGLKDIGAGDAAAKGG